MNSKKETADCKKLQLSKRLVPLGIIGDLFTLKLFKTSQHYSIEGFKVAPYYARKTSLTFFAVWLCDEMISMFI